jgi:hypothetical protein
MRSERERERERDYFMGQTKGAQAHETLHAIHRSVTPPPCAHMVSSDCMSRNKAGGNEESAVFSDRSLQ